MADSVSIPSAVSAVRAGGGTGADVPLNGCSTSSWPLLLRLLALLLLYTIIFGCALPPALHVIGIYEGPEVAVEVSDDSRPIVLALSAYSSTHWKVTLHSGVRLSKVILGGYHAQRVSGIPLEIPVETYTHDPSPCKRCWQGGEYFYSYKSPPEQLKRITGLDPTSFQGRYRGSAFAIFPGMKNTE